MLTISTKQMLTTFALLLASAIAQAQTTPALEPGEYLTEKSWGTLKVKKDKAGKLFFNIDSIGDNGHGCTLEGEIKGGRATLEADDPKQPCVVTFASGKGGIVVDTTTQDSCRFHCGVRAMFEGTYMRPPAACRVDAVDKSRAAARKAYDRKAFDEAKATLTTVLKDCPVFLSRLTDGWLRNDLAVTLHKLKDPATCREVLKPLAEEAAMTDAQVRENYPPTDAEMYLPVVKATRTNLKLCGAGKR